jgi:hypothetical protein
MFRTTCLGVSSAVVRTCICSTAPLSLSMIFAETTPGSVRMSSSARLIGSTLPAILFKFNFSAGIWYGSKQVANIADD